MRQMVMVGFLQAQNCTNLVSSWRHPESRNNSMSADYYRTIGRVLEEGKFHLGFFDDRLAMPDRYGNDHRHTVEHGIRCVKMDPITVLTVMGMATERLGLGATCSTTYFEPFHVARVFATLDLMTGGRAAWNVVTSMNDGEALNMGYDEHLEHDSRYDRADEFMAGRAWPLELLGRRRHRRRQADRAVRASRQGATARSPGPMVPLARSVHCASVAARSSRCDPGRTKRSRQAFFRALGRARVRLHPHQHGAWQAALSRDEGGCRKPGPRPRTSSSSRRPPMSSAPQRRPKPRTRWR